MVVVGRGEVFAGVGVDAHVGGNRGDGQDDVERARRRCVRPGRAPPRRPPETRRPPDCGRFQIRARRRRGCSCRCGGRSTGSCRLRRSERCRRPRRRVSTRSTSAPGTMAPVGSATTPCTDGWQRLAVVELKACRQRRLHGATKKNCQGKRAHDAESPKQT